MYFFYIQGIASLDNIVTDEKHFLAPPHQNYTNLLVSSTIKKH